MDEKVSSGGGDSGDPLKTAKFSMKAIRALQKGMRQEFYAKVFEVDTARALAAYGGFNGDEEYQKAFEAWAWQSDENTYDAVKMLLNHQRDNPQRSEHSGVMLERIASEKPGVITQFAGGDDALPNVVPYLQKVLRAAQQRSRGQNGNLGNGASPSSPAVGASATPDEGGVATGEGNSADAEEVSDVADLPDQQQTEVPVSHPGLQEQRVTPSSHEVAFARDAESALAAYKELKSEAKYLEALTQWALCNEKNSARALDTLCQNEPTEVEKTIIEEIVDHWLPSFFIDYSRGKKIPLAMIPLLGMAIRKDTDASQPSISEVGAGATAAESSGGAELQTISTQEQSTRVDKGKDASEPDRNLRDEWDVIEELDRITGGALEEPRTEVVALCDELKNDAVSETRDRHAELLVDLLNLFPKLRSSAAEILAGSPVIQMYPNLQKACGVTNSDIEVPSTRVRTDLVRDGRTTSTLDIELP